MLDRRRVETSAASISEARPPVIIAPAVIEVIPRAALPYVSRDLIRKVPAKVVIEKISAKKIRNKEVEENAEKERVDAKRLGEENARLRYEAKTRDDPEQRGSDDDDRAPSILDAPRKAEEQASRPASDANRQSASLLDQLSESMIELREAKRLYAEERGALNTSNFETATNKSLKADAEKHQLNAQTGLEPLDIEYAAQLQAALDQSWQEAQERRRQIEAKKESRKTKQSSTTPASVGNRSVRPVMSSTVRDSADRPLTQKDRDLQRAISESKEAEEKRRELKDARKLMAMVHGPQTFAPRPLTQEQRDLETANVESQKAEEARRQLQAQEDFEFQEILTRLRAEEETKDKAEPVAPLGAAQDETPLILAARTGLHTTLASLLEHSAVLNADAAGNTALHHAVNYAAIHGDLNAIAMLSSHYTITQVFELKNKNGDTPFTLANGNEAITMPLMSFRDR